MLDAGCLSVAAALTECMSAFAIPVNRHAFHFPLCSSSSCAHSLFLGSGYGPSNLLSGDHSHTSRPSIRTTTPIVASSCYEAHTLL